MNAKSNIEPKECPHCKSTHTGVKNSTMEGNLRKQTRICLDCKRPYICFYKDNIPVAIYDNDTL